MKFFILAMLASLLLGCVEEYTDSIELYPNGSAEFKASLFPCELDSGLLNNIKEDYESLPGVKFDTAWFLQRDSAYSLNFKVSFENLLTWKGKDIVLVGNLSLKKIDSLKNGYSFERVLNGSAESEDGFLVPEDNVSEFAIGQMAKNDSAFWEYSIILPKGAVLINSEPVDMAVKGENPNVLQWRIPAGEAVSKRISFKADFHFPVENQIQWASLVSIIACFAVMLIAIAFLVRKLRRLGSTLEKLESEEKNYKEE
jgi:hypothetical protein